MSVCRCGNVGLQKPRNVVRVPICCIQRKSDVLTYTFHFRERALCHEASTSYLRIDHLIAGWLFPCCSCANYIGQRGQSHRSLGFQYRDLHYDLRLATRKHNNSIKQAGGACVAEARKPYCPSCVLGTMFFC